MLPRHDAQDDVASRRQVTPPLFDSVARSYDERVNSTPLGQHYRRQVFLHLERYVFPAFEKMSVLDIGCGTGDDAIWLARLGHRVFATDISSEMVSVARSKAQQAGLTEQIQFAELDVTTCPADQFSPGFDLLLGNFGVLNCLNPHALRKLAVSSAAWVRPGGRALFVVMSTRGQMACDVAVGTESWAGAEVPVWYHSAPEVTRCFAPAFSPLRVDALSVIIPPAHRAHRLNAHPRSVALLAAVDVALAALPAVRHIANSYILDLAKGGTKNAIATWNQQLWHGKAPAPAASFQASSGNAATGAARTRSDDADKAHPGLPTQSVSGT